MANDSSTEVPAVLPRLVSSNKIEGTPVLTRDGDKLGAVAAFLIDRFDGQVDHVVVAMGGVLGLGSSYHPVPWCLLRFDPSRDGYVLSIDKAVLSSGPSFKAGGNELFDAAYAARLLSYFGLTAPR